jgi:hypothetical protein
MPEQDGSKVFGTSGTWPIAGILCVDHFHKPGVAQIPAFHTVPRGKAIMEKTTYNMKELADLLDVGESTLANQIIPVIKAVLSEILDETVSALIDKRERIAYLEEEILSLHRRLSDVEAQLFPERAAAPVHEPEVVEPAMVDLESVLGIEMEGALPAGAATADSEEKALQQAVEEMRAEGLGFEEIARHLDEEGIAPPTGKEAWTAETVEALSAADGAAGNLP